MSNPRLILIIFSFVIYSTSFGQDTLTSRVVYPKSISFSYGIGNIAVKDYFFSNQKYNGIIPLITLEWMQPHDRYGYRMGIEFRNSNDIKNNNISTTVTQFSLYQDFLYYITKFRLFKKDVYTYLGPSLDYYFYYNQHQFTESGIYFDFSFVTMISAAADVYLIMPLNKRWSIESNLRLSILSLGIQMPEVMEDDGREAGATIKLLTPYNGLKLNFDIGARFFIISRLSISLAYRLEVANIIIRKRVSTVSDNLTGTFAFHFN